MIRWKRSTDGYVESHDGQWQITPNYFSRVKPVSFALKRRVAGKWKTVDYSCSSQAAAKLAAERIAQ